MMMLLKALSDLKWQTSEENNTYFQCLNFIKMKTKTAIIVGFLMVCFFTFTSMNTVNSTETFEGIYDGKKTTVITLLGVDDDGEYTMTFQEIDESLLKSFDLESEMLIGTKFKVTYTITIKVEKDEDGYEDEIEIYTIIDLKKAISIFK